MHASLKFVEHRPWALPSGPWIMAQEWHDLLFAHWPVETELLRKLVPRELEIDRFKERSWIGVVPFRMAGVRLHGTPAIPGLSEFPELNVRTYVVKGGKPGVWFFSLDATNRIAVAVARAWFHLPYFRSRMRCQNTEAGIEYAAQRRDRLGAGESLVGSYEPVGSPFHAARGTLEYFLAERYCLYAQRGDGTTLRSEIHHAPWELQTAQAKIETNTMTRSLGVPLRGEPLLHFAKFQDVVVWRPQAVGW